MRKEQIVIFPFMAKGHTVPLLHLAAALHSCGLRVTFFTTPANAAFLRRHLPSSVDLLLLPFPSLPTLPPGVESTDQLPTFDLFPVFISATALLRDPFRRSLLRHLSNSSSPPLCLISDFFLGWTLPLCRRLGIPRIVFHGMSLFSMAISKSLFLHRQALLSAASDSPSFHVPGMPPSLVLAHGEVPPMLKKTADPDHPANKFLAEVGESDVGSWGVLVNSYAAVDRDHVALFDSFYRDGARAWLVGPLSLLRPAEEEELDAESGECLRWLDGKEPRSVVYVSFGTQAQVPDAVLDEVVYGLDQSGREFLWAVRSETWAAPDEGTRRRGRIVRGWAPQREILGHAAVGGFLSHCGWNSVLESLSAGVPILAWPMIAEQQLNAKHVVEVLGAGIRVAAEAGAENAIDRRDVERGVTALIGDGETGRSVRDRAAELGRAARAAVAEGGSSRQALEELTDKLRELLDGRSATQWRESLKDAAEEDH